ncbi:MAG: glycosyltransferase [Leptospirales bacterium]|jgi:glycosyltransferase involved in cell wall biosynthesis
MLLEPRVLHLNTAKTWRGGERQVWFLAQGLKERGLTQWVVGRPGGELEERCRAADVPFHGVAMRGEWDLLAVRRLRQFIREHRLNILHTHTSRAHGLGLMAAAGTPECKLVVSRRVDFPASKNWLSRRKYLSSRIARYIAVSENVKRVLLADGVPAERIDIAYSGIDLTRFETLRGEAAAASEGNRAALRSEFGLGASKPRPIVIGNVAALVDHKDQATLLDALAGISATGAPEFRCLIFGEGELRDQLESRARELDILNRRVFFAGFRDGIDDAYRLFDIFVMSSKEEGLGTAVLDAMGFGLPVAATAGGGIPEMIVDGEGGYLSPVGDAAKLGRDLRTLIESPDLRERFGAYNRERVKRFSHQTTCEDTLKIYRDVLKGEA